MPLAAKILRRIAVLLLLFTSATAHGQAKRIFDKLSKQLDVTITAPSNQQVLQYSSALSKWVNADPASGGVWGGITGTMADQTDLQGELDAKQSLDSALALAGFSSITGRIGKPNLPLGAQMYDNAGTPVLAADFATRQLFAPDGTTSQFEWSTTGVISFMGSTVFENGISDGAGMSVDPSAHRLIANDGSTVALNWNNTLGIILGSGGIFSEDSGTYFDDSGFHGNGSALTSLYGLTLGAGQSVRRNAGNSAYEAFTAGTGTVTSFSAGDLSPLFTTSEATVTTTPALTFALSNAAAWSIFGNGTSGSAAPTFETATGTGSPVRATSPTIAGATVTGQLLNSTAGAASAPASYHTGAIFTGGSGTTNFPHVFVQPTGATASTTWSTAGTALGINAPTGFTGDLLNAKLAGASTSAIKVDSTGNITGANFTASNNLTAGPSGALVMSGRSVIKSSADGLLQIANQGLTGFTRLNFGLLTNSAAAIGFDAVNGFTLQSAAGTATWNDASTAGSGTVANRYLFGIAAPTLTTTNATVTDTVASTVYIGGAPTASTNTTIGTAYALNVAAGNTNLGGTLSVTGASTLTGGATVPAETYGAGWDGDATVPRKDDVYDKIEAVAAGVVSYTVNTRAAALNTAYKPSTTRDTLVCASVNIVNADDTGDGKIEILSDAANPPTTVIGTFRLKTSRTGGTLPPTVTNTGGGMLMGVVKANNYYYLKSTDTSGTNTFSVTGNVMENVQ